MQDNSLDGGTGAPGNDNGTGADFPLGVAGFQYSDLYRPQRLGQLTATFYAGLQQEDPVLHAALTEYTMARGANLRGTRAESELLIAAAPHLSRFVARLFHVEAERASHAERIRAQGVIFQFKTFISRRALKRVPPEKALTVDADSVRDALAGLLRAVSPGALEANDAELGVAHMCARLLEWEEGLTRLEVKGEAAGKADGEATGAANVEAAGEATDDEWSGARSLRDEIREARER
ncbi:MAG TPA: hypothetical protein VGA87_04065, partial [Pyrinomonadaceae bacterium]